MSGTNASETLAPGFFLVDECEANRLLERPGEKVVVFRTHDNEKHGNMCAFADSVSIEVGMDAHSVAVRTGVKRRRIKDWWYIDRQHLGISSGDRESSKSILRW